MLFGGRGNPLSSREALIFALLFYIIEFMICGSGVDIIEIDRVRKTFARWNNSSLRRVFTSREIDYCKKKRDPYPHYAARFAAKEALIKAMASKSFSRIRLSEIEIVADEGRERPQVKLAGNARELARTLEIDNIFVSLSHSKKYAVAHIILENHEQS